MKELITVQTLFDRQIIGATNGDLWFKEVDKTSADRIVTEHHYSHKPTSNSFVSLLVNDGLGVLQLGYGIRPKLKGKLAEICQDGNWCEFDRMWLSDELPKFSESRLISLLFFYLKFRFPKIKFVITYADESAGNKGIIYQATNATELEGKEVDFYILPNGERVHPVTMWHRHGTRTFAALEGIYPGIIRVRGNNVQGNHPKEILDRYRGMRQRQYIYGLDRNSKKLIAKVLAGCPTPHAPDVGDSPRQQAFFSPEADTAEGKLPAPAPRR